MKDSRWLKDTHDDLLKQFHAKGQTDPVIRDSMAQLGHHFSVATVQKHRVRLKLEPNTIKPVWEKPPRFEECHSPIHLAREILGKRYEERPSGFWLDGMPVSLNQVMQAANRARQKVGMPQIVLNEAWAVPPERPSP